MPRIRTIKPEFWSDEKMSIQDAVTRLVFLGLISHADDAGRLVDNVKQLDGMIFPSTADSTRESLATLSRLGRIIRYTSASGQELIQIAKWKEHQKVDKPAKYVLPGPTSAVVAQAAAKAEDTAVLATPSREPPRDPRETLARSSRSDLRPTTYDHGPTTEDQRPKERSGKNHLELPPAAREFGRTFYRSASAERVRDIKRQLRATLNGAGAQLRKGVRVRAGSPERLEAKCREVIREGVKDPDRAIVVLLTKLADVSDDSPTDRAAEESKREERRDETDIAQRLADAEAWLADNPDIAERIDGEIEQTLKTQGSPAHGPLADVTRRMMRRSAVVKAYSEAHELVGYSTEKSP